MSMSKQDIINKWKPVWVLHCEKCNSNKVAKSSINNSHLKVLPKTFSMIILKTNKKQTNKKTILKWLAALHRVCDVKYIRLKRRNKPLILVLNSEQVRMSPWNTTSLMSGLVSHLKLMKWCWRDELSNCVTSQNNKKGLRVGPESPIQPTHWSELNILFLFQAPDGPLQTSCALSGCFWMSCSQLRPSCTCAPSPSTAT